MYWLNGALSGRRCFDVVNLETTRCRETGFGIKTFLKYLPAQRVLRSIHELPIRRKVDYDYRLGMPVASERSLLFAGNRDTSTGNEDRR